MTGGPAIAFIGDRARAAPRSARGEPLVSGVYRDVADRSWPTSPARAGTSRPSGPSASTRAEATITPSAPALASARTCRARLTPNPTATGIGETALTSRTSRPTDDG